jgi:stage V sporulation protein AD
MIYDIKKQEVHSGGSGCGCLPSVAFSYIINQLKNKNLKKVLLLATGALHNPSMLNQKESIPSICHAISMEVD